MTSKYLFADDEIAIIVSKHGDHDQSSHGNWAHGIEVAPEVVRSILDRVRENGGLSVNLKDGSEPTKGFMVAKGKKYAAIVKADDFYDEAKGAEILSSYMKQHKADLATGKNYLGLWHNTDDGQVYLDVSENIQDEAEATSRGRARDQISIWDVANFKEIPTGGTGGIEKTRGGRTARFITDDRRTNRRIRETDLGEIGTRQTTTKVIYFEYGLKPVLKHEGHEDQESHGNWARGGAQTVEELQGQGYTREESERIMSMKEKGPTLKDLDSALEGNKEQRIDEDKARFFIDNERELNDMVEQRIEDKIDTLEEERGSDFTEDERLDVYDGIRDDVIDDIITNEIDRVEEVANANGDSLREPQDSSELVPLFNSVYEMSHEGILRTGGAAGTSVTLSSKTEEVFIDGTGIHVKSNVYDENGNLVTDNPIERVFSKDPVSGTWSVEHKWLELNENYRGTGFGGKFLQQSEDWYISQGISHIKMLAGLEDGARHWANAGFDFDKDHLEETYGSFKMGLQQQEFMLPEIATRFGDDAARGWKESISEGKALLARMKNPDGKFKDISDNDFPRPFEFASLGADKPLVEVERYGRGKQEYWLGKAFLEGRAIYYTKGLTAEGRNLLAGPIDMDGDGLVYDGTAREKPAPGGK